MKRSKDIYLETIIKHDLEQEKESVREMHKRTLYLCERAVPVVLSETEKRVIQKTKKR